jgi:hypothetical protein
MSQREFEGICKYRLIMKTTAALTPIVLAGLLLLGACSSEAKAPVVKAEETVTCGWDTSAAGGQTALSDFLSETDAWLTRYPGEIPPAPESKYWLGDCPTDGVTHGPPVGEGDTPHE